MKILLGLLMFSAISHARNDEVTNIIGKDDRYQIKTHPSPFYKAVGLLQLPDGTCTGTLISPKHVLTNGHCVTESMDKFPTRLVDPGKITFSPGKLGSDSDPLGTFRGVRIETFMQWVNDGDTAWDVAVIELNKPVALPFVILQRQKNTSSLNGTEGIITGYPGDKAYGTLWESKGKMEGKPIWGDTFFYQMDSMPGTSGAIIRARVGNKWQAVGVHRGYVNLIKKHNEGVIFTPRIYDAIINWVRK